MTSALINKCTTIACTAVILLAIAIQPVRAAESSQPESKHFTYEFYYKVRWGYFGEWMELYKKNHHPILKRLQEMGRIVRMEAAFPIDHDGEADRWDLRITIVYRDLHAALGDFDGSAIVKELYPDQKTFKREEQRRMELLLEHRDISVRRENLDDW